MLHQPELRSNSVHPLVIAEAQGVCADAAAEVDVLFPIKVPRGGSMPALDGGGKAVVGMGYIGAVLAENILICHNGLHIYI